MANPRKELLVNTEVYHVYNRTNGNTDIFRSNKEFSRVVDVVNFYRLSQKLRYSKFKDLPHDSQNEYIKKSKGFLQFVEIYAYAFMSDHYHFLLKQTLDNGIKRFVSDFQNSYAKYFNLKNERSGSLFQKPFKAKRITNDEMLLHVSRYIHLNPVTSYLVEYENYSKYPWTSYLTYLGQKKEEFINTDLILKIAGSPRAYEKFVKDQVNYQRELGKINKFIFD